MRTEYSNIRIFAKLAPDKHKQYIYDVEVYTEFNLLVRMKNTCIYYVCAVQ